MTRCIKVNGPVPEADVWLADEIVQLRFKAEPGYELSRWLGHCRQWFSQNFQLSDVVPGATSLTLMGVSPNQLDNIITAFEYLPEAAYKQRAIHEIEVGYHPNWMDTAEVCEKLKINFEQLVDLHSNSDYYLAFVGFLPGFVYLGGGNPLLDLPRKDKPAPRLPLGSVGIAPGYTGIYPQSSPGGWHIIGLTTHKIFTPEIEIQTHWQAGDRVRLIPVMLPSTALKS